MSHDLTTRPYATHGANPPAEIPDAHLRALDRRHALDEQQRNNPPTVPPPHFLRSRPPS